MLRATVTKTKGTENEGKEGIKVRVKIATWAFVARIMIYKMWNIRLHHDKYEMEMNCYLCNRQ